MMNQAFRYPLSFVRCSSGAFFFGSFFRLVLRELAQLFLPIDLYIPREAPLSDDLERFPRLFRDPRSR